MVDYFKAELQRTELSYTSLVKSSEIKRKQTMNFELQKNKAKAEVTKLRQMLNKKEGELKRTSKELTDLKDICAQNEINLSKLQTENNKLNEIVSSKNLLEESEYKFESKTFRLNDDSPIKDDTSNPNLNDSYEKMKTEYLDNENINSESNSIKNKSVKLPLDGKHSSNSFTMETPLPISVSQRVNLSPDVIIPEVSHTESAHSSMSEKDEIGVIQIQPLNTENQEKSEHDNDYEFELKPNQENNLNQRKYSTFKQDKKYLETESRFEDTVDAEVQTEEVVNAVILQDSVKNDSDLALAKTLAQIQSDQDYGDKLNAQVVINPVLNSYQPQQESKPIYIETFAKQTQTVPVQVFSKST